MNKRIISSCLILALTTQLFLGCMPGLQLWKKGEYFKTELAEDYGSRNVKSVGVYVFSDGEPMDGSERRVFLPEEIARWVFGVPVLILTAGRTNLMARSTVEFDAAYLPPRVTSNTSFDPSSKSANQSIALAEALAAHLTNRGYNAVPITALGHDENSDIDAAKCIEDAKKRNLNAAFIVNYTGLYKWVNLISRTSYSTGNVEVTETNWEVYEGFLYLSSATLFDARSGDELWEYSNYGMVENAHLPNLFSPYTMLAPTGIVIDGGTDYQSGAKIAANRILNGGNWHESFTPLPRATALSSGTK